MQIKKKIVTIGGGSGQYVLLSGLRDLEEIEITAIVSMVDSGGSTGRLRDEFGILPPGDVLKCLLALSPDREVARKIMQTRFNSQSRLNGHNAGNMLLSILSQYTGSFPEGIKALAQILNVKGEVLPVTTDRATLVAELTDGSRLYGETAIDLPRGDQREKIKNAYLVPHHSEAVKVYPPVLEAIARADYIIIGPGDLYTSIIPNFLVPGVKVAIEQTKARILYIINLMTKFGETHGFTCRHFVSEIEKFIEKKLDYLIINTAQPEPEILAEYQKQKAHFIAEQDDLSDYQVVREDLLETAGGIIRHDFKKLANLISRLINNL